MNKKILFLILPIFIFVGCGYTPLYKDIENVIFSISFDKISGNRNINNKIKSKLYNYTVNEKNINYNISFRSDYIKNIVAKDTTGAATEYKLIVETEFLIKSKNKEYKMNFIESFNMQKIDDKIEEQDYEESIKSNITNIITRKLILRLSQLK